MNLEDFNQIFLSTGSNVGNREVNLENAKQLLSAVGEIASSSAIYETAAWGNTKQQAFLNQVLQIKTLKSPDKLLLDILQIELQMGRQRLIKWGPRTIDIDILFYGQQIIQAANLIIPHPEIQNRRFILVPMNAIAAAFVHPVFGKTIQTMLNECKDNLEVTIFP